MYQNDQRFYTQMCIATRFLVYRATLACTKFQGIANKKIKLFLVIVMFVKNSYKKIIANSV